ncbi:hypothetical protein Pmani_012732 [Petrolisthes manimaculis]|uniref:Uncharacterized protein n=1 Tax=Petrolisthes manimaculis TaxID=1843537 RepID=A0AAE1PXE1_9EUCA|nr:hypothetical protein Pmani_012732 [Petrolisthes manimaculis]
MTNRNHKTKSDADFTRIETLVTGYKYSQKAEQEWPQVCHRELEGHHPLFQASELLDIVLHDIIDSIPYQIPLTSVLSFDVGLSCVWRVRAARHKWDCGRAPAEQSHGDQQSGGYRVRVANPTQPVHIEQWRREISVCCGSNCYKREKNSIIVGPAKRICVIVWMSA